MLGNPSSASAAPLVSFIIPVYNTPENYLRECLESILALKLPAQEREIIIADDGSDQATAAALDGYSAAATVLHLPHKGPGGARNAAMDVATGEYVQFVDSDDRLVSATYNDIISEMRTGFADILEFHHANDGEIPARQTEFNKPTSGRDILMRHKLRPASWGFAFRRGILGDLRFPEEMIHEDEYFVPLLYLRAERVMRFVSKCYYYRRTPGSIMTARDEGHISRRRHDVAKVLTMLQKKAETMESADKAALQRRIAHLTVEILYNAAWLTGDRKTLECTIEWLRDRGLYPISCDRLLFKHRMLRDFFSVGVGRAVLCALLPKFKK